MYKYINLLAFYSLLAFSLQAHSSSNHETIRLSLLENKQVKVWETIIYPHADHVLKMHRHEHNRVLIALDDGKLKIVNDRGQVHYLTLEKEKAYYLAKDLPGELHTDENLSDHPIKVMVIELNT
jgi:hypothetical protein